MLTEAGEHGDARSLFGKLMASRRPRPYVYQCYAALEQAAGAPEAARALFEAGSVLRPSEPKAKEEMVPLLHAWYARLRSLR